MQRSAIDQVAAGLGGCRWPAEWEPHVATWLSWPHNRETWPTAFALAERAFVEMAAALAAGERVRIGSAGRDTERAQRLLAAAGVAPERVDWVLCRTADAWVRDHGPIFLSAADGSRVALDFEFNNWGRKYPGWELDDAVPREFARFLGIPCHGVPFVLEGGSIDGDGRGTVLTTESCLLHPNRSQPGSGAEAVPSEARRSREGCEAVLRGALRCEQIIWLAGGIEADDTDGHVDDVARFVGPGRVVAARARSRGEPNFDILEENWRRLRGARDATGQRLDCVELPAPPPLVIGGARVPASYANFYLANGVALIPVFGVASDESALRVLEEALTGRRIVPIRCEGLLEGLGALHCCTKEEPAGSRSKQDGL